MSRAFRKKTHQPGTGFQMASRPDSEYRHIKSPKQIKATLVAIQRAEAEAKRSGNIGSDPFIWNRMRANARAGIFEM